MPLNFPNSPSLNDFFVAGGRRWQWNGTAWQRIPDPGAQGVQGNQGNTGPTGAQGAQGHQGATAAAGAQGAQGSAGSNGSAGAQGAQGVNGNFGGASFEYTYLTNTTDSDPGAGSLKFNNANLTSASILYIDDTDGGSSNTDIQPFLRTIDDSTSTIKGHVKVSTKTNPDQFVLYTIASLTEATGYFKVTVAYVSGSVTSFTNSSDVSITFARTGDAGSTGAQGAQGAGGGTGAQGSQGNQGTAAGLTISTGAPGSPSAGDLWWDSDDGDLHTYYNDGNSSQWVAINVGPMGAQGTQGHQGHQGATGAGAQGAQGAGGSAGSAGAQGAQGHQGAGGSAGSAGAQGAQGHQGAGGSAGAQGDDASLSMSTGAPGSPDAGDLWFDTDSGILSAYYADGSSNQWVEVSTGPKGDTGAQGAQGHQGNAGAQGAQGSAGSATLSNNADNRVITGGSGTNLNGEANLTFDGTGNLIQSGSAAASILRVETTANDGDGLIQADGRDSSGNLRRIMMRTDAGADQYRIISSDTSYNLALCTGNAPRLLIAGNSAATSIGGSNVFNAMLTVQGDISGQLLNLKATENTTRLMVSGNNTSGCELNLYDDTGGQRGILGVSGTEFFIKAPNTNAPLSFYTHNGTSLAERMVLKSDGKVGMQVATPKSNLHVYGPGDIRIGSQYGGHASITQQVSYSSGYTGVHWMFETNGQMSWSFDGVMIVHGTGGSSYGTEVTHIKLIYSRESGALNSGDTWRNGSSDYNIETLGHGQVGLNPSAGSFSTTEQTDPDGSGSTRSLFKFSWSASGQGVGVWSKLIGNFYWAAAGGGNVEIQDKDGNILFNSI